MENEAALREQLAKHLDGRQAYAGVKAILEGIPPEFYAKKVRGLPHSLWELLEHIRIAQRDILDYIKNEDYEAPHWPADYWTDVKKPSRITWEKSAKALLRDLGELKRMVNNHRFSLFASVKGGKHILLRELLIVAEHNAYHLGQMVILRRLLKIW